MIKFPQANLNNVRAVQALIMQTAYETRADIILHKNITELLTTKDGLAAWTRKDQYTMQKNLILFDMT